MNYNSPSALIDYLSQSNKKQVDFSINNISPQNKTFLAPLIKQRFRSQLDKLESNYHVGSSVLPNKYTKSSSGVLFDLFDSNERLFKSGSFNNKTFDNENIFTSSSMIGLSNNSQKFKLPPPPPPPRRTQFYESKHGNNIIHTARSIVNNDHFKSETSLFSSRSNFHSQSIFSNENNRVKLKRSNTTIQLRKLDDTLATAAKLKSEPNFSSTSLAEKSCEEEVLNVLEEEERNEESAEGKTSRKSSSKLRRTKSKRFSTVNNLERSFSLKQFTVKLQSFQSSARAIQRFRKAVRTVILLLHAVSSAKQKAKNNDRLINENISTVDNYVFDLKQYQRQKEVDLNEEARKLLKSSTKKRSEENIKLICAALIDSVPEFSDFPPDVQRKLAKVSTLQDIEAGRVIIRQNHKADYFYFIVSGIVAVSVSERNAVTNEFDSKIVAYLRRGKSFGELAIIHASARNATVTCHTDVSVLYIDREDFFNIFMFVENGKEPEHISFLREIDLLNNWPIERLPYNDPKVCFLTYFRKGALMCKESNKSEWVYVVKQGECRVLKNIKPIRKDSSKLIRPWEVQSKFLDIHSNILNQPSTSDIESLQNSQLTTSKVSFASKTTEEGLQDIIFGDIEGSTNVLLLSEGAECILINRKFFIKNLPEKHRRHLRKTLHPYPSETDLRNKFRTNLKWEKYKKETLTKVVYKHK